VLLPLHIKSGLTKNFVKALDMDFLAFTYQHEKFPRLRAEKTKAGVFIGPQIRQLFKDDYFECVLSDSEKTAWKSCQNVSTGLLGNVKAANFRQLVENLLNSYEKLWCDMSLSCTHTWSSYHHNVVPSATNMVSASIKTSRRWSRGTKAHGVPPC
jgi:hypothetical protein